MLFAQLISLQYTVRSIMTNQLIVRTLGQLTITLDGQPLTSLSSRTAEALLVYLMCEKRPFSRQFLADFLWDERTSERASANLRTLLTMMRKSLGDFLQITRQSVAFDFESNYWLDVDILETELTKLKPILHNQSPLTPADLSKLQTAVDLYQGPFLEGFYLTESRGFEEWMILRQERLQQQVKQGLQQMVVYCLDNGLYEAGITYAKRLIALDPFYELGHRHLMWLLVRNGQRNAALQQYQQCQQLLAAELAVDPSAATTAVYEQIRSLTLPPPCQLPPAPGPFIGRDEELTAVTNQLSQNDCRLLSLIGPGGIGKTSLATEAARRLHQQRPGHFLGGIHFIPLDPVESAAYLPLAIAEKIGLTFQGATDHADQLVNYLTDRELLLILDNFEHLLAEPAASLALLANILAQAPAVKLLITSRHRLNLREEWLFDVSGLTYPTLDSDPTVASSHLTTDSTAYSAPRLFVQQAQRLDHTFRPTPADWSAIIRLCQLLEGLPLGLELAAAWIRQTTCADIVARLEQSPDMLASQLYNVPARHRSVSAVFYHSWALLTDTEQHSFARLSVFRGSFSTTAATAIAAATPTTLLTLADKSLLRRNKADERYEMHPLLRQFAADQLNEAEKTAVSTAHAHYFAQRLAAQEDQLHGPHEQEWLDLLRANLPNLRIAWQTATYQAAQDDSPLLAMMLYSLAILHDVQGLYREGIELLQPTISALAPTNSPLLKGQLLSWIGRFQYHIGQYDAARQNLDTALTYLEPLNAPADSALALTFRGELARFENDFNAARRYQAQSIPLAQAAEADHIMALALLHTGKIEIAEGDYQTAKQVCTRGLQLAQQGGSPRQIAIFEDNLGTVFLELAEYETARQKFTAAYGLRQALGDQWGLAASLNNLGVLALTTGDYVAAVEKYRLAEAAFRHIGHRWGVALALTNLGRTFCYQQAYAEAETTLQRALRLWQEMGSKLEEGDVWFYLGQVALYQADYATAQTYLERSLSLFMQLEDERQLPLVWRELGVALAQLGQLAAARRYLAQSLSASVAQALTPDLLYALSGWAIWLGVQGKTAVSAQLLTLAATHPAAWHHEQAEARRLLAEMDADETAVDQPILTIETAVELITSGTF